MPRFYLQNKRNKFTEADILSAFPFLCEKGHVISLVGAGGKTSLMFLLAGYCCRRGMRVLVSTTTHIWKPVDGSYANNRSEVSKRWANGQIAVVGLEKKASDGMQQEKLSMLPMEQLTEYMEQADIVFLEADGSKRLPLKVPSEKEPVILPQCDIVIALCGMSCLGYPLKEKCFRLKEAKVLLDKEEEEQITEEDIARILVSEQGARKSVGTRDYYMVLNQCDDAAHLVSAEQIASLIEAEANAGIIVASCLLDEANAW
jgi:probable selenium-dependent hydroxylase accessory protein YqeC